MWSNKETFLVRTPLRKFTQWEAVVSVIRNSVKINLQWLAGEIRGQFRRTQIVREVQCTVKEVETGSSQLEHRWINESGEVLYTDNENYSPNRDSRLNLSSFKKIPARKQQGTDNSLADKQGH